LLPIRTMTPRRTYYEFDMLDSSSYFRVYSDGFFHASLRFTREEEPKRGTIHDVICYLSDFFIFALRVLKSRLVDVQQGFYIELSGLTGLELRVDESILFGPETFGFSKTTSKVFYEKDFEPSEDWHSIFLKICDFYKLICLDLGIIDVSDQTIRNNVRKILTRMSDIAVGRKYNDREILPKIDLNEMFSES